MELYSIKRTNKQIEKKKETNDLNLLSMEIVIEQVDVRIGRLIRLLKHTVHQTKSVHYGFFKEKSILLCKLMNVVSQNYIRL